MVIENCYSVFSSFIAGSGSRDILSTGQVSPCASSPTTDNNGFRVCLTGGNLKIDFDTNNMLYTVTVSGIGTNWNHYAASWSASKGLTVYKNGVLQGTSATPSKEYFSYFTSTRNLKVGKDSSLNVSIHIQNLKIWKFALSADEIAELYSPGK